MPIQLFWYGSDEHRQYLAPNARWIFGVPDTAVSLHDGAALVVEANCGPGARSERYGLQWLARFRRARRCLAPALVYSFESRATLAASYPMLEPQVPGTSFLQLPCTASEFAAALGTLVPIEPDQWPQWVRWHSDLQQEWRHSAHAFADTLRDWPEHRERGQSILAQWSVSIRAFAPDQVEPLEELDYLLCNNAMSAPECLARLRSALQRVDDGLCRKGTTVGVAGPGAIGAAPYDLPPLGFDSIAIADDNGYEEPAMDELRRLGYRVFPPARDQDEAAAQLRNGRPRVFLGDVHFPTSGQGLATMRLALETTSVRLVIAVSRASVLSVVLPDGVENCCGAHRFQDAQYIHRLIWRRAQEQGVRCHV